jgi:hypothetical protein
MRTEQRYLGWAGHPCAAIAAAVLLSVLLANGYGIDNNWDQLNFHFYAPLNLTPGRLATDFMAGSTSGYHNPLPYLPFHLMVLSGVSPRIVVSVLAALHAVNAILVFCLARLLGAKVLSERATVASAWIAMLLTLSSSYYVMLVATTFADILVSIPVLGALLLLTRALQTDPPARTDLLLAGVLAGGAVGLKLSVIHTVAGTAVALALVAVRAYGWRAGGKTALLWGAGVAIGWLAVGGFWMLRLWQEYGNPFFPLFNHVFQSPDYPSAAPPPHSRFTDFRLVSLLSLPFRMTLPRAGIFSEVAAVDLRFAAAVILGLLMLARWIEIRCGRFPPPADSRLPGMGRPTAFFLVAMAATFVLWGLHSGNGRYALPLVFGVSAAVVAAATWLFRPRVAVALCLCLLVANARYVYDVGNNRWSEEPWRDQWYALNVPPALKAPDLMLVSIDLQTNSFVLPFLHPTTRAVNLAQPPRLAPGVWGGKRAERLIDAHTGALWFLAKAMPSNAGTGQERVLAEKRYADWLDAGARFLLAYGLKADVNRCERLVEDNLAQGAVTERFGLSIQRANAREAIMACPLARVAKQGYLRADIDRAFERVEHRFPGAFPAGTSTTHPWPGGYARQYLASDSFLVIAYDGTIFGRRGFRGEMQPMGRVDDYRD